MHQPSPLDLARSLILSLSSPSDAHSEIERVKLIEGDEQKKLLHELYMQAEQKAKDGDVQGISTMLRVFEHFGDRSHDRMLLHYIAEAEANYALGRSKDEKSGEFQYEDLRKALEIISAAFKDADEINASKDIS
jgi:hypothetical protein